MALNPNIALQAGANIPQFDPMAAAQKGLSLVDLMQQVQYRPQQIEQQLSTARTAEVGAKMANEKMRREEAARVRLAALHAANAKKGPDDKIVVDRVTAAAQGAQEGLDPDILFNYMQGGEKTEQERLKTEADVAAGLTKRADALNEMIAAQKDPMRAMEIFKQGYEGAARIYGPERAKDYFTTYFDTPSLGDETVSPGARGARLIQNSTVNKTSKITALQQEELARTAEQQHTGPEYRVPLGATDARGRPADEKVRKLADTIIKSGLATEDELQGMTGTTMAEIYIPKIKENILGAGQRIELAGREAAMNASVSKFNDALAADADITKALGGDVNVVGAAFGKIFQDKLGKNPLVTGKVNSAIAEYNAQNPEDRIDLSIGWPAIKEKLMMQRDKMRAAGAGTAGIQRSTGVVRALGGGGGTTSSGGTLTPEQIDQALRDNLGKGKPAAKTTTAPTKYKPGDVIITGGMPRTVYTEEQAKQLPSGTKYLGTDGKKYTKN